MIYVLTVYVLVPLIIYICIGYQLLALTSPVSFPFSPSLLPSLLIVLIILFPYRSKFSEPNNKQ